MAHLARAKSPITEHGNNFKISHFQTLRVGDKIAVRNDGMQIREIKTVEKRCNSSGDEYTTRVTCDDGTIYTHRVKANMLYKVIE